MEFHDRISQAKRFPPDTGAASVNRKDLHNPERVVTHATEERVMRHCCETDARELRLIAYNVNGGLPSRLTPASASRAWMSATRDRFACRCLPLLIANQAGWFILNSHAIRVTWDGSDGLEGLKIEYLKGPLPYPAVSHFGYGILTWTIPYLFRTAPGFNLLVRGPANWPKDGAYPLEGIVESDWSRATFTINWKITRANHVVSFDVDEPICMIVPQRRGELESFQPITVDINCAADAKQHYETWCESRAKFLADLATPGSPAIRQAWQKHYFQGTAPSGNVAPEHQTKLNLRPFEPLPAEPAEERTDDRSIPRPSLCEVVDQKNCPCSDTDQRGSRG